MILKGITLDPTTNSPIIILKDQHGPSILPIWIGIFEANAIMIGLEKIKAPRPMTHDLIKNILDEMHVRIAKIIIDDLNENVFYATLYLKNGEQEFTIDARPSDAIAIALRAEAEIYVSSSVLEHSSVITEDTQDHEQDALRALLESMDPEDFGKYKM